MSEASTSEAAWKDFLAALSEATETITGPTGARDALQRAEGFRYLTRLLAAGIEMRLEKADPLRPVFTRMLDPTRKFLGDNPDTLYHTVPLDGRARYRVRGRRGNECYLAFCVYGREADGGTQIGANLSDAGMKFEADGSFAVDFATERPDDSANWVALTPESRSLIARQYFRDRVGAQPAQLEIEAIPAAAPPGPLAENELAERLEAVAGFVRETSELSAALSVFAGLNPVLRDGEGDGSPTETLQVVAGAVSPSDRASNQELAASIDPKVVAGHLPTPDIVYTGAWWQIGPDEAVVVEGTPPQCRYWSLQILNRWLESPDYRHLRVALNDSQAVLEDDGSFRVVIADRDPGVPNWLETAGHREGQVVFRALLCEDDLDVRFRIVKLAELR